MLLLFLFSLFCLNLAFHQYGYEIKDLYETDYDQFEEEVDAWKVWDPQEKRVDKQIENKLFPQLILSASSPETDTFYIYRNYDGSPDHKYATGSAKIWYSGDFSSESTLKVDIFLGSPFTKTQPANPCLTINIPRNQGIKDQSNSEYIYFGDLHTDPDFEIIVKVQIYESKIHVAKKPISFGLREVTIHLSKEVQNVTHPNSVQCPLGQGLNSNLICQDCDANCDTCFGPKPSQCLSCSSGNHWRGSTCNNCHLNCNKCTGLTEHECLGCNYGFFDYGEGLCFPTCEWPFQSVQNQFCMSPCKSNEYIWNFTQTCLASCVAPLVAFTDRRGFLNCKSPCPNDKDFLYMNGSCFSDCPDPLEIIWDGRVKFCKNPCDSTENYLYPNRSCRKECPVPLQIRFERGAKFCENQCYSKNLYLYQDGSCILTCPAPLLSESKELGKFCRNPCEGTSSYLYANRSCLKECLAPLQIKTEPLGKFCVNPCSSTKLYLYQNGSCGVTCPSPREIKEEFGVKYCLSPCIGEYIFKNGACGKECPPPLVPRKDISGDTYCLSPCEYEDSFVTNNGSLCLLDCPHSFEVRIKYGIKYCINPCSSEQYFFDQNKSCLDYCPYPLKIEDKDNLKLCNNPCSDSNSFLYDDQSCYESCPKPLRIEEGKFCKNPCDDGENQYLYLDGSCQEKCESPYKIWNQGSYKICQIDLSRAESVQIDQMRKVIEISNIVSDLGGVLSCLINSGDPTSILIFSLISMFEKIKYIKIAIPLKTALLLDQFSPPRTQIQNTFDEQILRIGILGMIALLISALSKLPESWRISQMLQKFDFILRWNILVPVLMRIHGDIVLYCLIEFQSRQFKNPITLIGILGVILTALAFYKIYKVRRSREIDFARWRFLFEIFTENNQFFILIYFARIIMYHLILGLLSTFPRLQAFSIMLMSCGVCFYLVWRTPVKKKISKIQYLIIEFALLLYNSIFGVSAVFDFHDILGQLMNILYFITSMVSSIIITLKIVYILYSRCKVENPSRHIQLNEEESEQDLPSGLEMISADNNNNSDSEENSIEACIAIE